MALSVPRSSRPAYWTRAALCVALAALIHLFGCAHGPAPTGASRTDAVLTASSACAQMTKPVDGSAVEAADDHEGEAAQCLGVDEPSVQAPRNIGVADQASEAARLIDTDTLTALPVRAGPPPGEKSGSSTHGSARALLGVWRT